MSVHSPTPAREAPPLAAASARSTGRPRWVWWLLALAVAGGIYWYRARSDSGQLAAQRPTMPPVPVTAVAARAGDMPVTLSGLGSVVAFNTTTVKSRVDGQLIRINFREGQFVHEGDLLAEVDPRPFEVQLAQAEGQLARDQAQLKVATTTLARFRELFGQGVVARQDIDNQAALQGQFEGSIKTDQALIDDAKLRLTYARVTAPISGRVGLRLVDVGNVVHATDENGIVVITQLDPIAVLFRLPEDDLPAVMEKLTAGETLTVQAYDRTGEKLLATGSLLAADNQIDSSTGTTRLKATFPNAEGALFPNQFVNVRLLLDTKKEAVIVPVAAIQRGPQGTFVYAVKPDHTVEVRSLSPGPTDGTDVAVEGGVTPGELVVVNGVDKLRAGSAVQVHTPDPTGAPGRPSKEEAPAPKPGA